MKHARMIEPRQLADGRWVDVHDGRRISLEGKYEVSYLKSPVHGVTEVRGIVSIKPHDGWFELTLRDGTVVSMPTEGIK